MSQYSLVGKKVVKVRKMTTKELEAEGWGDRDTYALVFDDGTVVYASRDPEGNGPGCLFGILKNGQRIYVD